jgi:hypothetical protein
VRNVCLDKINDYEARYNDAQQLPTGEYGVSPNAPGHDGAIMPGVAAKRSMWEAFAVDEAPEHAVGTVGGYCVFGWRRTGLGGVHFNKDFIQ